MRKQYISPLERMLFLSILFTMLLLFVRLYHTGEWAYRFYIWNTFLAVLPLLFSRRLRHLQRCNLSAILLIICWLAFFPNAPYMITDLFHYAEKPPEHQWFDLLLVVSAAWNGLLLGIISLMQVEQFLSRHLTKIWVQLFVITSFMLCGYGVYLGRYLRFNSWDAVANPGKLMYALAHDVLHPHAHMTTWAFTFLFGTMFGIIYYTLQQLRTMHQSGSPVLA